MGWIDPRRVRRTVYDGATHLGFVTTVRYPGRDLEFFPAGTPYGEVVVADPDEQHIALLQRFKQHWLIRCGPAYGTTDRGGDLTDEQAEQLARFAFSQTGSPAALADALAIHLDRLLPG
jgi:hypothetical protein